jgi:hypothetical protein
MLGVSGSLTSNYSADGSFTVTNSIGSSGGFTGGAEFNHYVNGHFYVQRYKSTQEGNGFPVCAHLYKAEYVSSAGDSFAATNKPPTDPYGRCGSDPNGLATMQARTGFYDTDRGRATDFSAAATIFDITVSGRTGYTNDIHIAYTNKSSFTEFVCGNGILPDAPILWSNDSAGN